MLLLLRVVSGVLKDKDASIVRKGAERRGGECWPNTKSESRNSKQIRNTNAQIRKRYSDVVRIVLALRVCLGLKVWATRLEGPGADSQGYSLVFGLASVCRF